MGTGTNGDGHDFMHNFHLLPNNRDNSLLLILGQIRLHWQTENAFRTILTDRKITIFITQADKCTLRTIGQTKSTYCYCKKYS